MGLPAAVRTRFWGSKDHAYFQNETCWRGSGEVCSRQFRLPWRRCPFLSQRSPDSAVLSNACALGIATAAVLCYFCPSAPCTSGRHILSGFLSTLAPPLPRQGCQLFFVIWLSPWGQTRAFPDCLTFVSQPITLPGARRGLGTVTSRQDKVKETS